MSHVAHVDHLIRSVVPCLLDAAGLKSASASMRKLPRLDGGRASVAAFRRCLSQASLSAKGARDAYWRAVVEEVLFWSEASVVTAVEGTQEDCLASVICIKRTMDEAWARFTSH